MQYLATVAFRLEEADVISYIDTVERDGVPHDRVIVTWGDPDVLSRSIDQYIVYYRQSDGLLIHIECSVRDFAPFIVGGVTYSRWTEVDGVKLPAEYKMLLADLDGPRVHVVKLREIEAEYP